MGGKLDCRKAGCLEQAAQLSFQESAGNSAGPEGDVRFAILRHRRCDHDVGELHASAGLEDAVGLGEHGCFVRTEIDDAIRDHDVGGGVWERQLFQVRLAKPDMAQAQHGGVVSSLVHHRPRHIDSD